MEHGSTEASGSMGPRQAGSSERADGNIPGSTSFAEATRKPLDILQTICGALQPADDAKSFSVVRFRRSPFNGSQIDHTPGELRTGSAARTSRNT